MLHVDESYEMKFKESWDSYNVWINVSGKNIDEMIIIRKHILNAFQEIRDKNKI